LTIVPLQLYFRNGKVKVELGVAKGKKLYDKRGDIAERDAKREIDRRLKEQY
jgi:SsrA-binding protein